MLLIWGILTWDGLGRWMYPITYWEEISRYAAQHQVDPYLVAAIIKVESNYNPQSVSPKGAIGVMQIMPQTAGWILSKQDRKTEYVEHTLFDPFMNMQLGTWYLHYLSDQFGGNEAMVLAAYNAGQGSVRRWLDQGVWDGSVDQLENIPYRETRHYVKKVLFFRARYLEFHNKTDRP